ncbi:MAG: glycine/betaine ABC transporter substrate-binding protein [Pseudodesulfovibrio sp.]
MKFKLLSCVLALMVCVSTVSVSVASDDISFGMPPGWPGATIKTTVVKEILESIGYKVKLVEVSAPIIYESMRVKDTDIFLGAWTPQQNPMLVPAVEAGKIVKVQTHLADAGIGICVSEEAWQGGVKSVGDIKDHADEFGKSIYNIEPGTGMHTSMTTLLKNNVGELGDWKHVGLTTPMMLAAIESRMAGKEWTVFGCWTPHWMETRMSIHSLESIPGAEVMISASTINTITRAGFAKDHPEVQKFLENFVIKASIQSDWINEFGYKKKPAKVAARDWIAANLDMVAKWLEGVKAADGKDAAEVLRAHFAK